jgi:hypothetical protein
MPRIESGRWRPYPSHLHRSSASHSMDGTVGERGTRYLYATTLDAKQRFQSGFLHQLPQVGSIQNTCFLMRLAHLVCRFVVALTVLQQFNDNSFRLVSTV